MSITTNEKRITSLLYLKNWMILSLIGLSITGCSRENTLNTRDQTPLAGCWEVSHISELKRPPSEWRLFSWRPDSSLSQSMIYEIGPRSRLWTMDIDVTVQGGIVSWDGYKGVLNKTLETMIVSEEHNVQKTLWRFVRNRSADSLMAALRSYTGFPYTYSAPQMRNDGWRTTDMADVGIGQDKINRLIREIKQGRHGDIHSFLIVKDNLLVVEEYFGEKGSKHGPFITSLFRDRVHHLASTTKSVTSILVGIAIDRGFINNVEDPIYQYLPEYAALFTEQKKQIRISHMLTMTPGYQWRQFRVSDDKNDGMAMWHTDDVIRFVLQKPLEAEPGKKFNYTNAVPTVTGEIIKNAVGMKLTDFAEKHLFHPLGITDYSWTSYPDGSVETDGGLALRPRDLAKIGQLFVNNGEWEGQRIVSENWIHQSTRERLKFGKFHRWGYGYHWMLAESHIENHVVRSYFVPGDGSQILAVFPDLRIVIVFTAGNYGVDPNPVYYSLFERYILPDIINAES
jgi:CubicO group peptidase (beta-lactamase class C family)